MKISTMRTGLYALQRRIHHILSRRQFESESADSYRRTGIGILISPFLALITVSFLVSACSDVGTGPYDQPPVIDMLWLGQQLDSAPPSDPGMITFASIGYRSGDSDTAHITYTSTNDSQYELIAHTPIPGVYLHSADPLRVGRSEISVFSPRSQSNYDGRGWLEVRSYDSVTGTISGRFAVSYRYRYQEWRGIYPIGAWVWINAFRSSYGSFRDVVVSRKEFNTRLQASIEQTGTRSQVFAFDSKDIRTNDSCVYNIVCLEPDGTHPQGTVSMVRGSSTTFPGTGTVTINFHASDMDNIPLEYTCGLPRDCISFRYIYSVDPSQDLDLLLEYEDRRNHVTTTAFYWDEELRKGYISVKIYCVLRDTKTNRLYYLTVDLTDLPVRYEYIR